MEELIKTGELYRRACDSLVGGVNSPVRAWKAVGGTPLFIKSADGAYLRDAEDGTYRDYVASWGPMILGHADPDVVRTICEAASRSSSYGAPCEAEIELAEIIKSKFPSIDRVRFVSSGTEAAMTALRLARGFTGRDRIVKFAGCYHGHSDHLLVSAGSGALTLGVPTSPGITSSAASDTIVLPYNSGEAVTRVFREGGSKIAAVIVEPWAGNMGLVPPEAGFLEMLRKITEEHGSLLIFDEIITGFRVPESGVQNIAGIRPDLTCLGKIIGGGLPVGAVGGGREVMEMLAPAGPVYQAGTLSGNPLTMAAGIATLNKLTETAYQKLEDSASRLADGFKKVTAEAGIEVSVSRLGSVLGLFFSSRLPMNLEAVLATRADLYPGFFHGMLSRGDYFAPSAFEAIFVSCAHTAEIVDATIANAGEVFAELASDRKGTED
ncbi:MAG: glutamate-1-semialdehyde 2,1-aminomutase [Synergistaceae bacterium]|nr:glutamate-1-semialdehyde 2,1-aminomutase [Synergistaceae bacterium]